MTIARLSNTPNGVVPYDDIADVALAQAAEENIAFMDKCAADDIIDHHYGRSLSALMPGRLCLFEGLHFDASHKSPCRQRHRDGQYSPYSLARRRHRMKMRFST